MRLRYGNPFYCAKKTRINDLAEASAVFSDAKCGGPSLEERLEKALSALEGTFSERVDVIYSNCS